MLNANHIKNRMEPNWRTYDIDHERYIPIQLNYILHSDTIPFDVFMKKGNNYFLFSKQGVIGQRIRMRLIENGYDLLYVCSEQKEAYDSYVEETLLSIMTDVKFDINEKAKLIHSYSMEAIKEVFASDRMTNLTEEHRRKIETIIDGIYEYFANNHDALNNIGKLLSHNNKTYNHCVNVSLYTMSMLLRFGYDRATAKRIGVGANLHDIGKIKIPRRILDKPGKLDAEEWRTIIRHPDEGLALCRRMDLDPISCDCVIHHHEKLDGSGYPGGIHAVPEHVRIVSIADIFDALTSDRPYSKRLTTFEALKIIIKDVEAGKLDKDICKEFVKLLSANELSA